MLQNSYRLCILEILKNLDLILLGSLFEQITRLGYTPTVLSSNPKFHNFLMQRLELSGKEFSGHPENLPTRQEP